jgi:hypothetical protein
MPVCAIDRNEKNNFGSRTEGVVHTAADPLLQEKLEPLLEDVDMD